MSEKSTGYSKIAKVKDKPTQQLREYTTAFETREHKKNSSVTVNTSNTESQIKSKNLKQFKPLQRNPRTLSRYGRKRN